MVLAQKQMIKQRGALSDLNVNPCKMCMPMGSCTASYGVQGALSILHGSQGCATYIRRHMATHYNEPVDIASSSLAEQETVYGGEKNLHKGIDNLIKMYDPSVICVSTTCLAETIGEDVPGMLARWREAHPKSDVVLVPIASPGYGGSQYEGFFRGAYAILDTVLANAVTPADARGSCSEKRQGGASTLSALPASLASSERHVSGKPLLNVICGTLSPADIRSLKDIISQFGINAVVFPDISDNLDRPRLDTYDRLPSGGTTLEQIRSMANAALTIELATFVPDGASPAKLLQDKYGVPYQRLNIPTALRDIDTLLAALSEFAGLPIPERLVTERGRYIDAMIDSHKYNAEGRVAIFGEPDFCYSTARLCVEQGIVPVVVAVGSKAPGLAEKLEPEIAELASNFLVQDYIITDAADFGDIERLCLEMGVNLLIGSSDGRRIEDKHGIPLVRCAFPIHDHIGGQRVRTIGFEGTQSLLDRITNSLLQNKETGFRAAIRKEFFDNSLTTSKYPADEPAQLTREQRTAQHPCFNGACASKNARIHLPVAPKCNISCNYCVRKFDCVNESRPGVTSRVLTPTEALERFKLARKKIANLTTIGIAGPGDALADWDNTKHTLQLLQDEDPNLNFCLSTNGLLLPRYANELAALGVTHVTVTVNAIDTAIGAKIYKFVRMEELTYFGKAGAAVLLSNQIEGIKRLLELGVVVKINTVLMSGINDQHVLEVSEFMAGLGVAIHNIMPMVPVEGAVFGSLPQVSRHTLGTVRAQCAEYLPQMHHCQQCRADAVGKLTENLLPFIEEAICDSRATLIDELQTAETYDESIIKQSAG